MPNSAIMKQFKHLLALSAAFILSSPFAHAEIRKFNMYTVEASGVKMWVPTVIAVHAGDEVEIQATSKIPGQNSIHGFTIEDFKIVETADENGKTIRFKASKPGIYTIRCHLHPAHVGGQLIVLKK